MRTFTTASEAKELIVNILGDFAPEHDIDAIYDEAFALVDGKITWVVTGDDFWTVAAKHSND